MWIAADWGTSNLRVWRMDGDRATAERSSDRGMGVLAPDGFEPALLDLVGDWLEGPVRVVVCGMAGARQGWAEAAYRPAPCAPLGLPVVRPPLRDPRLDVAILPGLSQMAPHDVMRGEETQIAGVLAADPAFEGTVCLPGTHSKWAMVSGGKVAAFRSLMTGEMFALLSGQSVLRHSMAGKGLDLDAFDEALAEALAAPDAIPARFFALRAEALLADLSPERGRGRLSGLLIGAELAAMCHWWQGRPVTLVGADDVTAIYARAMPDARVISGREAVLAGLSAAHHLLEGS
ncbi:2-dehydro-3-deoxygalactonokinase [Falsirhodobacter deserti]|uniref:2-dehydro-3-deoxygalactonokinase n=1 Tax=Falsirhodobacter deserti TaxID=1365611 RepID=UPI000FE423DC|nr:2-dehydro-3-deoxygalactonokinase [Falsirhodobacter deserti]